jgi:5-formyltetrahydrofolate cyclo-ligase
LSIPIQHQKLELRTRLRGVLGALPPSDWLRASAQVCMRLNDFITARGPAAVLFYMPLPTEIDVGPAARACLDRGVTVCLPRADWDAGTIAAVPTAAWGEGLVETRYGILEPKPGTNPVDLARLDLVVVPGLAFDAAGGRLGKGGGFYDRFLAQPGLRAAKVGVGLDVQVVESAPREAWDVPLDALITPTRTVEFGTEKK